MFLNSNIQIMSKICDACVLLRRKSIYYMIYFHVYSGTSLIWTPIIRKTRHPDIISRERNFKTLICFVKVRDSFIRKTR